MSTMPQVFLSSPEDFIPTMHVASCYITCQGRLLVLQTAPHKAFGGSFSAPGGKLEPSESPLAGVLRETFEETGLLLDSREVQHHTTFYVRYEKFDFVYHVFVIRLTDQPPQITLSPNEHISYVWVLPKELSSLPLMPAAYECFQKIFGEEMIF